MGVVESNSKVYLYINARTNQEIAVEASTVKQAQQRLKEKLYGRNKEMSADYFDWKLHGTQG